MKMKKQTDLIDNLFNQKEFTLIILDACRFDYFSKMHKIFGYKGDLECVKSPAGHTYVWAKKVFKNKKFNDVKFFSMHPLFNSSGITPLSIIPLVNKEHYDDGELFVCTNNFREENIIDLWNDNNIDYESIFEGYDLPNWSKNRINSIKDSTNKILKYKLSNDGQFPKKSIIWYDTPHTPYVIKTEDIEDAYKETLKITLKELFKLKGLVSNNTIITADHGEILRLSKDYILPFGFPYGRKKYILHEPGLPFNELYEVPWFKWDKFKKIGSNNGS